MSAAGRGRSMTLRTFVKSIPIVGRILYWVHTNPVISPRHHYLYRVKPFLAKVCIEFLRKYFAFNTLTITRHDCQLDNGVANFYWEPGNAYSLLGYPLRGDFETIETEVALAFARDAGCIVDVGGNFGWYACQLRNVMPKGGEIHIFEPVPHERDRLQNNLALNPRGDVKTVINDVCLSDIPGDVILYVPNRLGAAFASLAAQQYDSDFSKIATKAIALDAYCQDNSINCIDLMKIDVEGAEFKVLHGAFSILSQECKPAILVESSQSMIAAFGSTVQDVIAFLQNLGYRGHVFQDGSLLPLDVVIQFKGYDFLFIDPDNDKHTQIVSTFLATLP